MLNLKKLMTLLIFAAALVGGLPALADGDPYGDRKPSVQPVPEPSSALIFAAGLLVASRIARRRS